MVEFRGKHYQFTLMPPYFIPEDLGAPIPAVTLAAVGPKMLEVAGANADGVRLHPFCTAKYVHETVLPNVDRGLAAAGRDRAQFEISGGGFVATGPDDETVHQRAEWVRYRIGFYGSTPAYWPVLEAHDHGDLGRELNRLTKQGRWDELARPIPDDLLHEFAAIGRHDEIAARIEARFGGVSDTIFGSVNPAEPTDLPPGLIQDIQRIPIAFTGFVT